MKDVLNDLTGKKSSKRLAGLISIGVGLLIGLGAVLFSAFDNTANVQLVDKVITTVFTAGTVLLGVSTAEHFTKKSSKNEKKKVSYEQNRNS